jgi:hypothetical protein
MACLGFKPPAGGRGFNFPPLDGFFNFRFCNRGSLFLIAAYFCNDKEQENVFESVND